MLLTGNCWYNASKYAIEGMADTMRQELRGTKIYMSVLNTGPVNSNIRRNSLKTFKNINVNDSFHKKAYENIISGQHKPIPFSKDPIAVARIVDKILKSNNPKPRYYITTFTYLSVFLKKIFPTKALDYIFGKL